jgi:hypothetical protein
MLAYACVESISSDHMFEFYPPTNLLQLLFLRPLRLFLPSRHPFLQRSKFALLRVTHAPFVIGVTLFEQLFCGKNTTDRTTGGVLRPPSSRSAKVAAKRASFYGQIPSKIGTEFHIEEPRSSSSVSAELGDTLNRMKKVEEDISDMKAMLHEILDRLGQK